MLAGLQFDYGYAVVSVSSVTFGTNNFCSLFAWREGSLADSEESTCISGVVMGRKNRTRDQYVSNPLDWISHLASLTYLLLSWTLHGSVLISAGGACGSGLIGSKQLSVSDYALDFLQGLLESIFFFWPIAASSWNVHCVCRWDLSTATFAFDPIQLLIGADLNWFIIWNFEEDNLLRASLLLVALK